MTATLRRTAVLTAALGSLLLSACGGVDRLDQAELTKKADAICERHSAAMAKVAPPAKGGSAAATATAYARVAAIARDQHTELAKLKADTDVAADWDAFVDLSEQTTDLTTQIAAAAKSRDTTQVEKLLVSANTLFPRLDAAAKAAGTPRCGTSPSAS